LPSSVSNFAFGMVIKESTCFDNSAMDGFAVRSQDTFGASESQPALLDVTGKIGMGDMPGDIELSMGQAARIWTGGCLPRGSDAVVMLEYTAPVDNNTIEVFRAAAPLENVIERGEDCRRGSPVLYSGTVLRPQELGLLAGLGITRVQVRRRPLVAVISTGDELVPEDASPAPGQIRDMNSTTLAGLVEKSGGRPVRLGIVDDSPDAMFAACSRALEMNADIVLVSGGSSVGRRDFTLRVFERMEGTEVLAHGVSIRPGKPTILARCGNTALFGLPGHAASAVVTYLLFVHYLITLLLGRDPELSLKTICVRCSQPFPSSAGREEFVRVRLDDGQHGCCPSAKPVYGKSGLISTLIKADGLLVIPRDVEGLHQGEEAEVLLFP